MERIRTAVLSLVVLSLLTAGISGALGTVGASSQQTECSFPVTATDATGTEVVVEEEPETVVTLGPSAAQTMWEIGAQDKVVGVSKYASYLEGTEKRANISGAGQSFVVVEKVVAEDPDLVLAPNIIQNETVQKLRESGLTVYRFGPATSMDDIVEKTRFIGELTGTCEAADERAAAMEEELSAVRNAVQGEDRPKVLYVFGGYTPGEGTFIDEIITTAGGTNVAAEAGISGFKQISAEVVVDQNPEYILVNTDFPTYPQNDAYNGTDAVKNGNIITLDANYVSQPAPRTMQVVTQLTQEWHPEAYEEALAAQQTTTVTTADTTTTKTTTTEMTTTEATETTTETPGVGIIGALIGLVLATIVYRRR